MEQMSDDENETDKINVVPLADLSLVLLIILMVLSPMVMSSMIRVQTPRLDKAAPAKASKEKTPDPLLIKITAQGLLLNNNAIDSEQFLGEQIAIKTKKTSTLRCSSGGDNTLLYNPALKVANALQSLGSDDGCWLLIEGKIK